MSPHLLFGVRSKILILQRGAALSVVAAAPFFWDSDLFPRRRATAWTGCGLEGTVARGLEARPSSKKRTSRRRAAEEEVEQQVRFN